MKFRKSLFFFISHINQWFKCFLGFGTVIANTKDVTPFCRVVNVDQGLSRGRSIATVSQVHTLCALFNETFWSLNYENKKSR